MPRKISITIADDDFDDQQLLETALKETVSNCQVNSVYTGKQLLTFLAKKTSIPPDLIFLDLNMPGEDGLHALKQMNEKTRLSVPVCVLSARNSEKDMKLALDLGAVAYYNKPANYAELLDIVKTVCNDCLGENFN